MSSTPPDGTPERATSEVPSETDNGRRSASKATPGAGWYPAPNGQQRYWDGEKWLDLPAPPDTAVSSSGMPEATSVSKNRRTRKWLFIAGAAVLLLGLIAGGIAWKVADSARQAEAAAASSAAKASEEKAKEEAAAASASAAAQERADDAERASRLAAIPELEASVKTLAEQHVTDGIIDGPIIKVTCSPVGGGSTDDLTQQTTVFECFVANKDNGDGTMSGYPYNATMNWSTGSYTYGFGAP